MLKSAVQPCKEANLRQITVRSVRDGGSQESTLEARVIAALSIIAICTLGAAVALAIYLPRRRREKLRRRGIKNYQTERSGNRTIA